MDFLLGIYDRYPRATAQFISTLIVAPLMFGLLFGGLWVFERAQAAEPAAPTPISDNCQLDSTIGILEIYYCESSFGPDYYANSFGFVVVID